MKHIQLFTIFFLAAIACSAQQLATSSFYDLYGPMHNPATAGSQRYATLGGSFRTQWSGMPGAPQTAMIFGSTYMAKSHTGIGAYLYNDVTGPTTRNGLEVSYAYHIPMANGASFSLGLEGRFQQFTYDRAKLQGSLGNDPVISGNDKRIKGDAGFGIAFTSQKFQIGASVSQLVQSKLGLYEQAGTTGEQAKLYRHYYLHGFYKLDLDQNTKLIPSALFIYLPNAPNEFQGGVRIEHNDLFWYGLSLRAKQSWMLSAGVRVKHRFNIGYSFDIYTTPLSVYDRGSNGHEILLRYDFIK